MTRHPPTRGDIHTELEHARTEFRDLIQHSTPADLARPSNGTRWTNRQLLFHMLFGYLITRNLRHLVKIISRAPRPVQNGFAGALDAATQPFHIINYWGSRLGGTAISPKRMINWSDRIIDALQRHLDAETDAALQRSMSFPTRWDPYFTPRMTLHGIYHYATLHFEHHRRQLSLAADQ